MSYSLTIDGYTFDNPPESYRKHLTLGNSPVPHFKKSLAQFYQSGQQELQFEVEGRLSLNEQSDLDELEELQQIAIQGGEVDVHFDPFFSGKCIIEDDPFRQSDELGRYKFIFTVNSDDTDSSAYPDHATPTTGNTFKLGSFDFGYDPESVEENYERQTTTVDRLQGVSQSTDNDGLVTKVTIDGNTDGGGLKALWNKARNNELSYLDAEFQQGWALIADLSIQNNENAPHYLKGLFRYDMDLLIVSNPEGGIGNVSSYIDHDVKNLGTYVSDEDAGDSDFTALEFTVNGGSGSINDSYVEWDQTTLTLTDDATNWVYVNTNSDVVYNNSGFPADALNLYRVHTSGGQIVKIEDVRAALINDSDSEPADFSSEGLYGTVTFGDGDTDGGAAVSWPTTTVLLDANTTNWIYSDNTGEVQVNQSGFPADVVPMWEVDSDANGVTSATDHRPDDLSGSSNTSNSDLVFSTDFVLDDSGFAFARVLALTDSFDIGDAGTLPWLGMATLDAETIPTVTDDVLESLGMTDLSELVSVDDGGSAIGGTTEETKSWSTGDDWDNSVDEQGVVHEDYGHLPGPDTIQLGYPTFDRNGSGLKGFYQFGNGDLSNLVDANTTITDYRITSKSATGLHGGTAWDFDGNNDYARGDSPSNAAFNDRFTIFMWVNIDGKGDSSWNRLTYLSDGGNSNTFGVNWDEDDFRRGAFHPNGVTYEQGGLPTQQWLSIAVTYDGSTVRYYENGQELASSPESFSFTVSELMMAARADLSADWTNGRYAVYRAYDRHLPGSEIQRLHDAGTSGTITTATKSFSGRAEPDLQNLSYSLNGQSIDVTVVGSPGAANEERNTVTLDGATSYEVDWASGHEDFRLEISLSTSDLTQTPTFSGAELFGQAQVGEGSDQNPNTEWTIRGGQYDTSGNEYEGGGVVTEYAQ